MMLAFPGASCRTHDTNVCSAHLCRASDRQKEEEPRRASPVWPGGSFSDSLVQGGSQEHRRVSPAGTRILKMLKRKEEGGLFKLGGRAPGGVCNKRRNRLRPCGTARVFLSGGITSTFRQEQELGGKQQQGLTAPR